MHVRREARIETKAKDRTERKTMARRQQQEGSKRREQRKKKEEVMVVRELPSAASRVVTSVRAESGRARARELSVRTVVE